MTNLELKDGTPYNMVQIDGKWYFADALFNQTGSGATMYTSLAFPKELKLVPPHLIPSTVVKRNGKTYAYAPESRIKEHFNSQKWRTAAKEIGTSQVSGDAYTTFATTALANNLAQVDEKKRSAAWKTVDKTPANNTATNGVVGTSDPRWQASVGYDWSQVYGTDALPEQSPWGYLKIANTEGSANAFGAYSSDSNIVQRQGTNWLVLADDSGKITKDSVANETAWRQTFSAMPAKEVLKYQDLLRKSGYLGSDYATTGYADSEFLDAIIVASRDVSFRNLSTFQAGGDLSTQKPWDLLSYLQNRSNIGADSRKRSSTSTSTNYFEFNDAQARSMLESFYAEAIGRRPSDKEVSLFRRAVETEAKKNPSISTSRTTYDFEGNSSTSSTSKQGYTAADAELAARTTAEEDPRANAFLTSTKYFDAFLSALRGPLG